MSTLNIENPRSLAVPQEQNKQCAKSVDSNLSEDAELRFLAELTTLSQKYRLGICGAASIFIMEWDDDGRKYACDSESKLSFC